jgi:predicted nucleic acid-binding protein
VTHETLLDTGPLVAYLNRRDRHHAWAVSQWQALEPPLLTCEAVLSEACFLLASHGGSPDWVMDLVERGIVSVGFSLKEHFPAVRQLLRKYRSIPMSLADACLVRMSELRPGHSVLTTDRDFLLYRREGRHVIPTRMPDGP